VIGDELLGGAGPALATGGAAATSALGRIAAATPAGLAAKAGRGIAARGGIGAAGAGLAVEGALHGAGYGVGELAVSEDPLTAERIAATVGSAALLGGVAGGGVGLAGKALSKGLSRWRAGAAHAAGGGEDMVTAIQAHRAALREAGDLFAVTGTAAKGSSLSQAGGRMGTALKHLERHMDAPKELARRRGAPALRSLEALETSYRAVIDETPALRRALAAEGKLTGARAQALDAAPRLLEENRALQAAIVASDEAARAQPVMQAMAERQVAQGISGAVGFVAGGPIGAAIGLAASPMAKRLISELSPRVAKVTAELGQRLEGAVDRVLSVGAAVAGRSAPIAAKALTSVQLGPTPDRPPPTVRGDSEKVTAYRARVGEIRAQVATGPSGRPEVTTAARTRIANDLAPIAAVAPRLADQLESTAVRKLEYLAAKIPQRPGGSPPIGPDTWRPSDFDLASFARRVAAVEDPASVIERVADGSLTPEDAEAMRAVYPELYADLKRQIVERLPELREGLPYERRLMLSIFFGVAVDPAMAPNVLGILQGHFLLEEGTAGGTQAPLPQPNFGPMGSVAKEKPTAAQERAG
jgi:hypothetical protein